MQEVKELMNRKQTETLLSMYMSATASKRMQYFMPVDGYGKKWVGATEGHHFILVPENEYNKVPEPTETTVNISALLPEYNYSIAINPIGLKQKFDEIEIVKLPITEECDACDGDGVFEHFGETYNCQSCNETGEIETGAFESKSNPNIYLKILKGFFDNQLIQTLLKVIKITDATQIKLVYQSKTGKGLTLLQLDNEILIGISGKDEIEESDDEAFIEVPTNPITPTKS